VQTTVEDKGSEPVKVEGKVTADTSGQGRASVEVNRTSDGKTNLKQSAPSPRSQTQGATEAVSSGKKP
jgi:hypothetical protein